MPQQKSFSTKPGLTGVLMSVLLIVSFFLPRIWEQNATVESLNTLLIVMILWLAVRLIKNTSLLYDEHLYSHKIFPVLMAVPVFNLAVTAVQFVLPDASFMLHPVAVTLLIVASLPAFCCYYFTAMWLHFRRDRRLLVSSLVLDAAGLVYILIRLAHRVIVPALSLRGTEITQMIDRLVSFSPWVSLVIYILSLASFIICAKIFSETSEDEM